MHILNWLLPPLLGAVIALATNWIAIVMLFRPHTEKRIFGLRVPLTPGLIPRERAKLGQKLGAAISVHLLTPEVLAKALANLPVGSALKNAMDALLPKAAETIENFHEKFPEWDEKLAELTGKVVKENVKGLATLFVNKDKIYGNIKSGLVNYLTDEENLSYLKARVDEAVDNYLHTNTHQTVEALIHYIATHIPIAEMIERKMAEYDVAEAERMILSVVGRELKIIVLLGGIFGFLIGLLSLVLL